MMAIIKVLGRFQSVSSMFHRFNTTDFYEQITSLVYPIFCVARFYSTFFLFPSAVQKKHRKGLLVVYKTTFDTSDANRNKFNGYIIQPSGRRRKIKMKIINVINGGTNE